MADQFGARKDGTYLVVATTPDVCGVPPAPPMLSPFSAAGMAEAAGEAGADGDEAGGAGSAGGNSPGAGAPDVSAPPPPPVPASMPAPFPIVEPLSLSVEHALTVRFNGSFVVMLKSFTDPNETPESGPMTGLVSGTTGQAAEPIEHSISFKVEGDNVVRVGDAFFMNNQNTDGILVFAPAPQESAIEDNGAINV